jgi:hypothetical protein
MALLSNIYVNIIYIHVFQKITQNWNGRKTVNDEFEYGSGCGVFQSLSPHMPEGTDESHKIPWPGWSAFGQRIKPGTSQS